MNVAELLTPKLWELAGELRATLPRVQGARDDEAVHDMRVAIRRIRSLLKPSAEVYGRFHTDAVRARLKALADATGDLRDEEVLEETLSDLPLAPAASKALASFVRVRKKRLGALRRSLIELVEAGEAERAVRLLEALITLPVKPKKGQQADAFARRTVEKARAKVEGHRVVADSDVLAMHALRILYKRLRYAVDGFSEALTPELRALSTKAARFQKRLGELHDIDVAIETVRESADLADSARGEILAALEQQRARAVSRYHEELARPDPPPEPLPTPAPQAQGRGHGRGKGRSAKAPPGRAEGASRASAEPGARAGRQGPAKAAPGKAGAGKASTGKASEGQAGASKGRASQAGPRAGGAAKAGAARAGGRA